MDWLTQLATDGTITCNSDSLRKRASSSNSVGVGGLGFLPSFVGGFFLPIDKASERIVIRKERGLIEGGREKNTKTDFDVFFMVGNYFIGKFYLLI
jgi:hypothetical protein